MNLEKILEKRFFPRVRRPGRYLGGELHAHKPSAGDLQVALAFPDLYEIGFAYVGFQILYNVLRRVEGVSPQRVYAPAEDAEQILRDENIPLFTLEGKNPLQEMDIIGFSLQYELHPPDILNMLELGSIPLRFDQRDDDHPLVIGGGPLAFNPESLAPFFDLIYIGDGEEMFPQIAGRVRDCKFKNLSRQDILEELSQLPGVYIPAYYRPQYHPEGGFAGLQKIHPQAPELITASSLSALSSEYYPQKPLVPLISVEHDRLSVEIMRGCTRGCRFCNAGLLHRPTREIPAAEMVRIIRNALQNTGYEEISLLSLSTADYSELASLLNGISEVIIEKGVTLSYPSLRLDAFSEAVAESIPGRKTGLTFAPEAGSERLRRVINKDLQDDDLFRALEIAAKHGWQSVKLYFMVGLPTETDDDILAIVELAKKCHSIMGASLRKPIHISLAVFSPKPHTPFQRAGLISASEAMRRINFVRDSLGRRGFKVSYHDPAMTAVETIISRGDRRIAGVVERAFRAGARFQSWSDEFDLQIWQDAVEAEGFEWDRLTDSLSPDAILPWRHISSGISDEFLLKEGVKAEQMLITEDCRVKCSQCGLECKPPPQQKPLTLKKTPSAVASEVTPETKEYRYRCKYSVSAPVKYISHLEKGRLIERAFRRLGIRFAYSEGFHPRPKISFAPALPLGYESKAEYFDFSTPIQVKTDEIIGESVEGLNLLAVREIERGAKSLSALIQLYRYEVTLESVKKELSDLMVVWQNRGDLIIPDRKGRDWNITGYIEQMRLEGDCLKLEILLKEGKSPRPDAILKRAEYGEGDYNIIRTECCTIENFRGIPLI